MRHEIFGAIAVGFFLASYAFYLRGVFRDEVRPHFFTWIIWLVTLSITLAAQIIEGAGPGAWPTAMGLIFTFCMLIHIARTGDKNFTRGDWISLIVALTAIPVWYITKNAAYAAIISTGIDCVAYYPTFRKSYRRPYQEDATAWALNIFQHIFVFFALEHVTVATACYPVTLVIMNTAFVVFLLWRRYKMKTQSE